MIVAAALVPQAPLMLPGLTGRSDPAAEMRCAAAQVVADLVRVEPDEVVLVASGDRTGAVEVRDELGLHRWGVAAGVASRPETVGLQAERAGPVSLPFAVGSTLLEAAGWQGARRWQQVGWPDAGGAAVAVGAELAEGPARVGLLVLGDGSARRTLKAPGHLDERAAYFDDALVDALTGDPARLADVDPALASELMVSGLPAWQALAGALSDAPTGPVPVEMRWSGDPFGVMYVVGWVRPVRGP